MVAVMPLRRVRRLLLALLVAALLVAPLLPLTSAWAVSANATQAATLSETEISALIAQLRTTQPDYADDFDTISGDWTETYDVEVSTYYKSGQRRISVDAEDLLAWSRLSTAYSDFYAEVETTQWEGRTDDLYGIIFRFVDRDNFYIFAIGSDGFYVLRRIVGDEWQYLVEWSSSEEVVIGEGAVNKLGVVAQGDTITVLVNDVVLAQVQDDSHPAGMIGLVVGTYQETGVDIGFDNFRLWSLPEELVPTPTPARRDRPGRRTPATPVPTLAPTEEPAQEPTAAPTATLVPTVTPAPTATPLATPEPEAEGDEDTDPALIRRTTPTLVETFDTEPEDWLPQLSDQMRYGVIDGELAFGIDRPNALGWVTLPPVGPDYYVEVDTTFSGGVDEAEWGLLYRLQDSGNFFFYAVNNLGMASIWLLQDNEWQILLPWATYNFLESGDGATNQLGLLLQGDRARFYANDILVAELVDGRFAGGGLALGVGSFVEPELTVFFDNVRLWELAPVAMATETPVPAATTTPEPEAEPEDTTASGEWTVTSAQALVDSLYAAEPAITDDFRRDDGDWSIEDTDSGQTYYARRAYHVEVEAPEIYLFGIFQGLSAEEEADGYFAEVTITFDDPETDGAGGLVFRRVDNSNFYYLTIDALGRYQLWARRGENWTELIAATRAAAWEVGSDDNRLGVLADNGDIAVVVNGNVEAVLRDPEMPAGGIGLLAQSARESLPHVVIFDNFALWHIRH